MATIAVNASAMTGDSQIIRTEGWALGSNRMEMVALPLGGLGAGLRARHRNSDFIAIGQARRRSRREAAPCNDGDAVGDFEQLVELFRDDEDGGATGAKIEQRLADDHRSPDIDAPGRLRHDQYDRVLQYLPADDELLQVSAGKAARLGIGPGATNVETGDAFFGEGGDAFEADQAEADRAVAVGGEQRIFGQRQRRHRTPAKPVFGHRAEPQRPALCRIEVGDICAIEPYRRLRSDGLFAGENREQFLLAVAGYAGNTQN